MTQNAKSENHGHSVSLVVITLNEEENIARCIQSVPWADEIIVLDSGSTDRTLEIAKKLGARTFVESWRGYRDQKARAVELASHDWILSLDADEALSEELDKELIRLLSQESGALEHGYEMPRVSYHLGRWIWHGGWYPDWQVRLFHRGHCQWSEGHVHERVVGEKISRLRQPIRHWPFKDISAQVQTNDRYSSLAAEDLSDKGRKFSLFLLMTKPISKFVETYFLKRGFRDGLPGFLISVSAAYSMFLKWAKLWEKERNLPSKATHSD